MEIRTGRRKIYSYKRSVNREYFNSIQVGIEWCGSFLVADHAHLNNVFDSVFALCLLIKRILIRSAREDLCVCR